MMVIKNGFALSKRSFAFEMVQEHSAANIAASDLQKG
jgi:hypothetical protein